MSNAKEKEVDLYKKINDLEVELAKLKRKKYGLVWEDKPEVFDKRSEDALPVLKDKGGKFKDIISDKNSDFNVLIEGDNYHSLSVLSYTHKNKVDVIYIDPPYNTGNKDFVYNDHFVDKEDRYRHSKWLSFMSKRLKLAKKLLKKDGIIFISIDDNEQATLKMLVGDIFGEQNFEMMVWDKVTGNKNAGSGKMKVTHRFRKDHEYIACVYLNKRNIFFNKPLGLKEFENEYGNKDNDPRGDWMSCEICKSEEKSSPNGKNYFTLKTPSGRDITRQWHYSKDEIEDLVADNRIYFGNGNIIPRLKKFLNEEVEITPTSIIQNIASTTDGNDDIKNLGLDFDNPKPVSLIKYLINFAVSKNKEAVVLDFFCRIRDDSTSCS